MKNRILVSATPEEISMAVVIDGTLTEYVLERENNEHIVGNIFKGKVQNLLKGIQAAFINVGRDKNVFFYNNDQISLSEGQTILVQVVKDAMGSKGARAVNQLSLAGRYAVFLPGANYVGVSKNIKDAEQRARLKEIAENARPKNAGIIVRSVSSECTEKELKADIEYLAGLWSSIEARAKRTDAPALLHREVDLPIRIIRDYLTDNIEEVVVDNQDVLARMQELAAFSYPNYQGKFIFHAGSNNIFKYYGFAYDIQALNSRQVELKCGGYLVFDYTEALTVIDVNTGSFKGANSLEDTAYLTNMQATQEIARQIKLRDLGGIIVIDFIDMLNADNKKQVVESLEAALTGDKMKPRVLGITKLGLVEMTRKKSRQNSAAALFSECPTCLGSGFVKSPETVSVEIRRSLSELKTGKSLLVKASPSVADWFIAHELEKLPRDKKVKIQAAEGMNPEVFSILDAGN